MNFKVINPISACFESGLNNIGESLEQLVRFPKKEILSFGKLAYCNYYSFNGILAAYSL